MGIISVSITEIFCTFALQMVYRESMAKSSTFNSSSAPLRRRPDPSQQAQAVPSKKGDRPCFRSAVLRGEIEYGGFTRWKHVGNTLAPDILPGLLLANYWSVTRQQKWSIPWHRNQGIELMCVESGSEILNLPQQTLTVHAGEMAVTRPWQLHKVGGDTIGINRCHFLVIDVQAESREDEWIWPDWVILSAADKVDLANHLRRDSRVTYEANSDIPRLFNAIAKISNSQTVAASLSQLAIVTNELLRQLLEEIRSQAKTRRSRRKSSEQADARMIVQDFLDELPLHLGEEWTLDQMSSRCGLGMTRFVHHCKIITNLTPMQFLNRQRVLAAAEKLLVTPDRSITDIALECGFASSQYFATVFRQYFNCSPRVYRSSSHGNPGDHE